MEKIFALDIGTHSIVGMILEKRNNTYFILDIEVRTHRTRAMKDGQIHDIPAVSLLISDIKKGLETRNGALESVFAAAAGRSLKTQKACSYQHIADYPIKTEEDIRQLEREALEKALIQLSTENGAASGEYICAGYSVLSYMVDGHKIGCLLEQYGLKAGVEIIAAFLPKGVVESLTAALNRASLQLAGLTLEPIAAISALVGPSMRNLNLALVDIGAGTADVAITDQDTVIAYGMVPAAGDRITESLARELLLDFQQAEKVKRELMTEESITVKNVLGHESRIPKEEAVRRISPALDALADSIAGEIIKLNHHKPPQAVILIGGGSQTPKLPRLLAGKLQLPEERVVIQCPDAIPCAVLPEGTLLGPEYVTPIGIGLTGIYPSIPYIQVTVNDQKVSLFQYKQLTVREALAACGKNPERCSPDDQMMTVELNHKLLQIPLKKKKHAALLLNQQPCFLEDPIVEGDSIKFDLESSPYSDAIVLSELLPEVPRKTISINGITYVVEARVFVNGRPADRNVFVKNGDRISCRLPQTIQHLLESLRLTSGAVSGSFKVRINSRLYAIEGIGFRICKNGAETYNDADYEDQDDIVIERHTSITIEELCKSLKLPRQVIEVSFNGKKLRLEKPFADFFMDGKLLDENNEIEHLADLTMIQNKEGFIFQDIFQSIEIEMPPSASSKFLLLKNNKESSFDEQIEAGDELKLMWPASRRMEKA
ncbi:cell division protein FtsA [Peribacillus kribbensis]|uniref:cell division protein FtsA n=1 Tax=Peribacillus kribbensis TaxID=356658 RepID=UPI000406AB50|nr:cell division FtsA domain-containing protein [Peribacillus kribbensis]